SPSTEDYDRGDKLSHYKQIESLQAIVLVSHSSKRLTVFTRDRTPWAERDYRPGERASFGSPAVELRVDDVYSPPHRLTSTCRAPLPPRRGSLVRLASRGARRRRGLLRPRRAHLKLAAAKSQFTRFASQVSTYFARRFR